MGDHVVTVVIPSAAKRSPALTLGTSQGRVISMAEERPTGLRRYEALLLEDNKCA